MSPKGRHAKSKARITAYNDLLAESEKYEKTRTAQIIMRDASESRMRAAADVISSSTSR